MTKGVKYLRTGDFVDLQSDKFADPDSNNPSFPFEYETVQSVGFETGDCVLVVFDSGFSCGFPPDHRVKVAA